LKWLGAVSEVVVLTQGTAECRMEDVEDLLKQVKVNPIKTGYISNCISY
jgi:hypothetical protein